MPPEDKAIGRQKGRGWRDTRHSTNAIQATVARMPRPSSSTDSGALKPGTASCAFSAIRGGKPVMNAIQYAQMAKPTTEKVITENQSIRPTTLRRMVGSASAASMVIGRTSGSSDASEPTGSSSASTASGTSMHRRHRHRRLAGGCRANARSPRGRRATAARRTRPPCVRSS